MKPLMKTILAATFLMSVGTTFAQANDFDRGDRGPRVQRAMPAMPILEQVVRALHRLDLSDEQKENIRAAMRDLRADTSPIIDEIKAGHRQLRELITATEYDENAVAEVAAKEGNLAAERLLIASRTLATVLGYLTDEQRARLDEMAAQRRQHFGGQRRH